MILRNICHFISDFTMNPMKLNLTISVLIILVGSAHAQLKLPTRISIKTKYYLSQIADNKNKLFVDLATAEYKYTGQEEIEVFGPAGNINGLKLRCKFGDCAQSINDAKVTKP